MNTKNHQSYFLTSEEIEYVLKKYAEQKFSMKMSDNMLWSIKYIENPADDDRERFPEYDIFTVQGLELYNE